MASERGELGKWGQLRVRARMLGICPSNSLTPGSTHLSHKQYSGTSGVRSHGVYARAGGGGGHSDPRQALVTRPASQPSCQHPPTWPRPDQRHHIDANINADDEAQQQQDGVAQILAIVGVGAVI